MRINTAGAVATGTRANLIAGLRSNPMAPEAVDATFRQAAEFTDALIGLYSKNIAEGEVGPNGNGVATESAILADRSPTVLLYGRVQSGKTAAMVLTAALALDNGFRIIVVLTADNVALVEQTARRFKAVDGPRIFSSIKNDGYEWAGREAELREDITADGLILVCAKNDFHLSSIIAFFQEIDAPSFPALILDDEADAATPDTTIAARSAGRANAPAHASTINRRVIENLKPGEDGESISEIFPHSLYVQVTATPYLFFLQSSGSAIRPDMTLLLEPGAGYCGGEVFFDAFEPTDRDEPAAPLVLVPDNELQTIARRRIPAGLAASVECFLLSAVAKSLKDDKWPSEGYKHLSHSSAKMQHHTLVAAHINRQLLDIRRELTSDRPQAVARFAVAYAQLTRTVSDAPDLDDLLDGLSVAIRQVEVMRINSETDVVNFGPRINFLVGGNILGRGLTIDDLLVTYYVREAQTSQMDTVWQHARMYGYRSATLPYIRVYLPRRLAALFKRIHESEVALRDLVKRAPDASEVILLSPRGARATRPNALDGGAIRVIEAGLQQFAPRQIQTDETAAFQVKTLLVEGGIPVDLNDRDARTTPAPIELIFALVEAVPTRSDDFDRWSVSTVSEILEAYREKFAGTGYVYVRSLDSTSAASTRERARLSGPEIDIIRRIANGVPALALLYVGDIERPTAWVPTLVLPANSPSFIFNPE